MKVPVEGHSGLYRDSKSGAILNCNDAEYFNYMKNKELRLKEKLEIQTIKDDVHELKDMMKLILSKLDSNS